MQDFYVYSAIQQCNYKNHMASPLKYIETLNSRARNKWLLRGSCIIQIPKVFFNIWRFNHITTSIRMHMKWGRRILFFMWTVNKQRVVVNNESNWFVTNAWSSYVEEYVWFSLACWSAFYRWINNFDYEIFWTWKKHESIHNQ